MRPDASVRIVRAASFLCPVSRLRGDLAGRCGVRYGDRLGLHFGGRTGDKPRDRFHALGKFFRHHRHAAAAIAAAIAAAVRRSAARRTTPRHEFHRGTIRLLTALSYEIMPELGVKRHATLRAAGIAWVDMGAAGIAWADRRAARFARIAAIGRITDPLVDVHSTATGTASQPLHEALAGIPSAAAAATARRRVASATVATGSRCCARRHFRPAGGTRSRVTSVAAAPINVWIAATAGGQDGRRGEQRKGHAHDHCGIPFQGHQQNQSLIRPDADWRIACKVIGRKFHGIKKIAVIGKVYHDGKC
jgi:hypothetical protein